MSTAEKLRPGGLKQPRSLYRRKQKPAEVPNVVDTSNVIARTNRFFVHLKAYGHCDANGRAVMALKGFNRALAPPDAPLALMLVLLEQMIPTMDYSSDEAMRLDLERFQRAVAQWSIDEPKGKGGK